ncbi:MAG: DUF4476 domain-containing protein [Myxococcales bacterium]
MTKTPLVALLGLALGSSALAAGSAPAYVCWSKEDPGCLNRRDGELPMDKASFEALLGKLGAVGKSEPQMNLVAQSEIAERGRYVTCSQLARVLERFPTLSMRVALLFALSGRVVDPENAVVAARMLEPDSKMAEYARRLLSGEVLLLPAEVEGEEPRR